MSVRISTSCRPGESTFPYHYELGDEELLVVVADRPTLRSSHGERGLALGGLHPFRANPRRASADEPVGRADACLARVEFRAAAGCRQVDSNNMSLRPVQPGRSSIVFMGEDADYWDDQTATRPSPTRRLRR
jgi:uncharacterized cupin superfamily protein